MKALLLAAGLGTRLSPLTNTTPKCLVPISSVPLIDYWLAQFIPSGIDRILVNTHHLSEIVESYLGNSQWKDSITLFHEDILLGTGGTLLKNRHFFQSEPFLVAHADNLTVLDLESLIQKHKNRPLGIDITMVTFTTDTPQTCGIVEVDEGGIVKKFHEKVANPPGNQANGAVYVMEPSIIQQLEKLSSPTIDISVDLLPLYLGKMQVWHNNCYLRDIGSPEALQKANQDVLTHQALQELNKRLILMNGEN